MIQIFNTLYELYTLADAKMAKLNDKAGLALAVAQNIAATCDLPDDSPDCGLVEATAKEIAAEMYAEWQYGIEAHEAWLRMEGQSDEYIGDSIADIEPPQSYDEAGEFYQHLAVKRLVLAHLKSKQYGMHNLWRAHEPDERG